MEEDSQLPESAPEQEPVAKSKTGLRLGQFTPGNPAVNKAPAPRSDVVTTNAEQAMLFGGEDSGEAAGE
jgi:hypothetical protein